MICGTRSAAPLSLWDTADSSPDPYTGENGVVAAFRAVLPVIHTPYVLQQEVL